MVGPRLRESRLRAPSGRGGGGDLLADPCIIFVHSGLTTCSSKLMKNLQDFLMVNYYYN